MKFCPKCGNKLPEGVKFCPGCGNRIVVPAAPTEPIQQPAQQPVREPVQQPPVQNTEPVFAQPFVPAAEPKKKSGVNWKTLVILLAVGALIIALGAVAIIGVHEGWFGGDNGSFVDDDDDKKDPPKESSVSTEPETLPADTAPTEIPVIVDEEEFTAGPLTIMLDTRFAEEYSNEYSASFASESEGIVCEIYCWGEDVSVETVDDFANYLKSALSETGIRAKIRESGDITYLIYSSEGMTAFMSLYVREGICWSVEFACNEDDYDSLEERFLGYAASVAIAHVEKPDTTNTAVDEFRFYLDDSFEETEVEGMTACYARDDLLVLLLKESFESLSSLLDTYTVEAYADIWIYYNGLNTETYYEGDLLCANYQADVDGTTYQYLAVFYQSEDGFWLMQFGCTADDFASLYGEMIEIAESVIID